MDNNPNLGTKAFFDTIKNHLYKQNIVEPILVTFFIQSIALEIITEIIAIQINISTDAAFRMIAKQKKEMNYFDDIEFLSKIYNANIKKIEKRSIQKKLDDYFNN